LMKENGLRALIVDRRHDQDAYGMVTETDIVYKVTAYGKDPKRIRVCDIMTKPCIVVNPDLGVEYVARLFANTHIRRAPVIKGDLLGIISISDILTKGDFVEKPKEIAAHSRSDRPGAPHLCREGSQFARMCRCLGRSGRTQRRSVTPKSRSHPSEKNAL
jgi:signal-transduction protein with cAMP-binding, CBS, and nucleotidyltransferase domain